MNKHDQRRREKLLKLLRQAQEQAEMCMLYLVANKRDPEEIADIALAEEHIGIVIEKLNGGDSTHG